MKEFVFRHPDFCPTVTARRVTLEILEMLEGLGQFISMGGRSFWWSDSYRSRAAYYSAMWRLKKAGLVAYRRDGGRDPVLILTERGTGRLSDACRPEPFWDEEWDGIWSVLAYDVPEAMHGYRAALRGGLRIERVGRLQQSVWVSPRDLRPLYSDLIEAAGVDGYAILFAARTVLGQGPEIVVRRAWDWDRLGAAQGWFLEGCGTQLARVERGDVPRERIPMLAHEELAAYATVMEDDPLLPRKLWLPGYRGHDVYVLHRKFQRAVAKRV